MNILFRKLNKQLKFTFQWKLMVTHCVCFKLFVFFSKKNFIKIKEHLGIVALYLLKSKRILCK